MDNKKDHDYLNQLWENKKQFWIDKNCFKDINNFNTHTQLDHLKNNSWILNEKFPLSNS